MPRGNSISASGPRSTSKRGAYGVVGQHFTLPPMAQLLPDPSTVTDLDGSNASEAATTRFTFEKDLNELRTYYTPTRGRHRTKTDFMIGILSFEYRVVDSVNVHTSQSGDDGSKRAVGSPFKSAVKPKNTSMGLVVSFAWKSGEEKKKCFFLVKVGCELKKSTYQVVRAMSGDDGAIISITSKDQDL
ncbi:hypothetical protein BV898_10949 [Hypsibius exemplaris]|uniref:Uncharacterized protein n=1 Tax=Hypsibius exemplaris TaxID=2072580 RepID=A0A1W0WI81_HYPEX|nr:hypothetical protein BV898_10949 [Hypsibius exemplaris]